MRARDQIKLMLPLAILINLILYFAFIPLANAIAPGVFITDLMAPDSYGYIEFSSMRTAFYPAFLSIIHFFFKTYTVVPIFQLIIYSIAVSSLCANIRLLFNARALSWLLFGALILNPAIFKFHLQILTESLSISIFCSILAVIARYLRTKNPTLLVWSMILASLGAGIRPSNYPLIIATGILTLTCWRLRQINWKNVITALTPAPLILTLAASLFYLKHGEFKTQSFLGHNLYGKVVIFTDESVPTQSPESTKMMADLFAPIREINTRSISPVLFRILSPTYDYARYQALSESKHQKILSQEIQGRYNAVSDDYYLERALEIIKAKPETYTKDVVLNYLSLWLLWDLNTPAEQQDIEAIIRRPDIQNKPYAKGIIQKPHVVPTIPLYILRTLLAILMLLSIWHSIRLLIKPQSISNQQMYLSFIALTVNGTYLLIALTQAGLSRYALSMWPGIFILGLALYINPIINRNND